MPPLVRYCLHCMVFNETRTEMRIDTGNMKEVGTTTDKRKVHRYEAECMKCGSVEYIHTYVRSGLS